MSSSNNVAPDDTVINIENDAISIPNQSREEEVASSSTTDNSEPETQEPTVRENLVLFSCPPDVNTDVYLMLISCCISVYLVLIFISLFLGTYNIFPILLPISLCSLFMAVYGELSGKYYFLITFMVTVAWNTIYAMICVIFYISFYASDQEFFLNKALYFCWTEKAEIFEKIGDNLFLFVIHLIFTVIEILLGYGIFSASKQRYTVLQKKYLKEIRRLNAQKIVESLREYLQQNDLEIVSTEELQSAQTLSNEVRNPYTQMLAQFPPPPSYESNTILTPPQTPLNGIPPPSYSILEREEQLEMDPLSLNDDTSQQSINNIQQLLSDTTQNSNDTTLLSPKNISNESTPAMSPSILD